MTQIKLPAKIDNLERLMTFIAVPAEKIGLSPKRIMEIKLAAEEALVNICRYAYPDKEGDIEISWQITDEDKLVVEIRDRGISFDLQTVPDPDLTLDISDRQIGGLGIFLIKKMIDKVEYRRDGEWNILTFIIRR